MSEKPQPTRQSATFRFRKEIVAPCRLPKAEWMPTVAVKGQDLADCHGTGLIVSFWQSHPAEKIMYFRRVVPVQWCILAVCALASVKAQADDPKPTPENTIHVQLAEPVKPQTFSRPLRFFLVDVIDRSGSAQPMLVFKPRGGIFLDHTPSEITRAGLETCLKSANMFAADRDSADFLLTVYLFNFGLSDSSGMDFFGKVEFAVTLKNPKTAKSQQITASGTSIAGVAVRKKNIQKNVQEDIERAFADALRNLLRGVKLRDAVAALDVPAELPATPVQSPAPAPPPATEKPPAAG